jgi:hypothetical protein
VFQSLWRLADWGDTKQAIFRANDDFKHTEVESGKERTALGEVMQLIVVFRQIFDMEGAFEGR